MHGIWSNTVSRCLVGYCSFGTQFAQTSAQPIDIRHPREVGRINCRIKPKHQVGRNQNRAGSVSRSGISINVNCIAIVIFTFNYPVYRIRNPKQNFGIRIVFRSSCSRITFHYRSFRERQLQTLVEHTVLVGHLLGHVLSVDLNSTCIVDTDRIC
ncbi:hypothetical protein D3C73_917990 [compost metagenome]